MFGEGTAALGVQSIDFALGSKKKNYILNRNLSAVHLDETFDEYEIRIWNDIEYYEISVDEQEYKVALDVDENSNDILIWDYDKEEVALSPGDSHIISRTSGVSVELYVDENSTELIRVRYIKS